jgi:surface antigen
MRQQETVPMNSSLEAPKWAFRLPLLLPLLITLAACSATPGRVSSSGMNFAPPQQQAASADPVRRDFAVAMAKELRARGQRVWCVPFARNATGIDLRGNARTWWSQAGGVYQRSHSPRVGAVMAFSATRKMPMGHVAVVSQVVSPREIRIDHANWRRNQVSLGMSVFDVSKQNDWSAVRVMSQSSSAGGVYPVAGFISRDHGSRTDG